MTGDRDRQGIGRASACYRPDRFGSADFSRDVGIGRCCADGYLPEGRPDTLLERCAPDVQREVQAERRSLDEAHHLSDKSFELGITADEPRTRKAVLQIPHQHIWVIAQQDRAHMAPCPVSASP